MESGRYRGGGGVGGYREGLDEKATRGPMIKDGENMRTHVHTLGRRKSPEPGPKARCACWRFPEPQRGDWPGPVRTGDSDRVSSERKGLRHCLGPGSYSGEPLQGFEQDDLILNIKILEGLPGASVVKTPPANAGETGSIPDLGRPHLPQGQRSP